jgi:hypothetical protein
VLALGRRAGIALNLFLAGGAVDARGVVVGVGHAGGGEFGQHGFQGGAGFGGEPAGECGHAVGLLCAQGEAAAVVAVVVAEAAVGVEAVGQPVGQTGELVGSVLRR